MKGNLNKLLKQATKLQENLAKAQQELSTLTAEGSAGGGMVTVVANGKQEIMSIKIDPEVVEKDDVEMLEDLIVSAVNQSLEKASEIASEHMNKSAGGLLGNLPEGFKLPGLEM